MKADSLCIRAQKALLFLAAVLFMAGCDIDEDIVPITPESEDTVGCHNNLSDFSKAHNDWRAIRNDQFNMHGYPAGGVAFLGDSHVDFGLWNEWVGPSILNRGIAGDRTVDVRCRLNNIIAMSPDSILIEVGANDLARGVEPDALIARYEDLLDEITRDLPGVPVTVFSIFPVAKNGPYSYINNDIKSVNQRLSLLTVRKGVTFINLSPVFEDGEGFLREEYHIDGIHLSARGYEQWALLFPPSARHSTREQ